jgi:hypothetical protein
MSVSPRLLVHEHIRGQGSDAWIARLKRSVGERAAYRESDVYGETAVTTKFVVKDAAPHGFLARLMTRITGKA